MSTSSACGPLVMICTNPSKVIDPIRSRCWAFASRLRVFRCPWCFQRGTSSTRRGRRGRFWRSTRHRPRRSEEEIVGVLHEVCEKERLTLPDELAARIAKASGRNLRRAILALESARWPSTRSNPWPVPQPDWEVYIKAIARLREGSSRRRLIWTSRRDHGTNDRDGPWRSASPRTSSSRSSARSSSRN